MRFICVLTFVGLLGQPALLRHYVASAGQALEPLIVVSVWYNGPRTKPPQALNASIPDDVLRADLTAIRSAGYNGITTWISWRDGEPRRGALDVGQLDRLASLAAEIGLHVQIDVYTADEPAWKTDGTNALAGAFYQRVRDHYSNRRGIEVGYAGSTGSLGQRQIRIEPRFEDDGSRSLAPQGRLQLWSMVAAGQKRIGVIDEKGVFTNDMRRAGEAAGVITRNQDLFGPLQPRTENNKVVVENGGIVARILESPDAIVIVALNHDERPRRRTLTFPPDLPEAIWQNMIDGTAVNFVMGPNGPFYEHRFEGYETLVLAIRKTLR